MKRAGAVVLVIAALVVLSACGSDSDSDDESGELSATHFASRANMICEDITRQVDEALKNVNPGVPAGEESAQAIQDVVTLDKEQIRKVDDLPAPESEQDEIDQLLDHWRDRLGIEQQVSDAAAANDDAATIEGLNSQLEQIENDANAIARKLGADKCERGGT